MSVLVVGLSHRSAPVEVLERLAVAPDDVPKLLEEMLDRTHVEEAVLLSTCNRIEVCAVVDAFHGGLADVTDVLGGYAGFPLGELSDHLFVHYAGSAVQHLFQLAKDLVGAAGMLTDHGPLGVPVDLWHYGFLFTPALTVGGGTGEVQRNIIGERALGLPHDASRD